MMSIKSKNRLGQIFAISTFAFVSIFSSSVNGQQGGGMGMRGSSTAQPALLQVGAVQKELGLSGDQIKDAKKLGDEYQGEIQKRLAKMGFDPMALQDLPPEERFAKFREMAQAGTRVAQETERGFRTKLDLLLEPNQNKRLGEIQIQALGVGALRVQDVSMKLGLSRAQRDELEKMEADSRQAMTARFQQGGGGGAPPVQGDSGHHGRHSQARVRPRRGHADECRHQRDDDPLAAACGRAHHGRPAAGPQGPRRPAHGHHSHRLVCGHFHVHGRRGLGQRQTIH